MAKINFTARAVRDFACPAGKGQAFLWDSTSPGLGLRVTPNGKPAFVFQAPFEGRDVRVTIGGPDAWPLPEARAKARELQRAIDESRDPRQLKRDVVAARVAAAAEEARELAATRAQALTVADVWPLYLANGKGKRAKPWKPRYRADLEAMAGQGGKPKKRGKGLTRPGPLYPLMSWPLSSIGEDSLASWHRAEAEAAPHQAARALMMFRGFLRWCSTRSQYRDLVDREAAAAPAVVENLPTAKRRTDALESAQVGPWWKGAEALPNRIASAYLRALLLTGARREEVAALKWEQVDFRWRRLTLADKIETARTIPLSPYVAQLLHALPRAGKFVFASSAKSGHIADARASHAVALKSAGIERLTFHGLRRSFSLLGEAAGAPAGAIAQVMGHKPSAVAEGYRPRSVDALRPYLARVESFILELAGVEPVADFEPDRLKVAA